VAQFCQVTLFFFCFCFSSFFLTNGKKKRDDKEEQNVSLPVRLVTSQIAKNHHGTDLSLFNAKSEGPNVALNMKVGKDLSFQGIFFFSSFPFSKCTKNIS